MPAEDYEKLPAGTVEAHKVSEAGEERYVLDAIIGEATRPEHGWNLLLVMKMQQNSGGKP